MSEIDLSTLQSYEKLVYFMCAVVLCSVIVIVSSHPHHDFNFMFSTNFWILSCIMLFIVTVCLSDLHPQIVLVYVAFIVTLMFSRFRYAHKSKTEII
jgi:uncharacterized membrane protein YoaK (UPF0700 family)